MENQETDYLNRFNFYIKKTGQQSTWKNKMEKQVWPENVPSVQVSINIPHGFSFSEERKFFNLDHHQRHNIQPHIINAYIKD